MPRGAEPSPVRVGFSIPKKKHRLSVNRHRIRRLLAEAWRLQKHHLYPAIPEGTQLQLFIIYTDTTAPTQEKVMEAVLKGMEQLKKTLNP
jgi:ribonuclease P protein component